MKIDNLLGIKKVNKILDSQLADKLVKGKKCWGWLDMKTLDEALTGTWAQTKDVFARLRANKVDLTELTMALKLHPSIEKKYRFVYEAYAGYMKTPVAKILSGRKRKRG
ncbi:hypothetical protein PC116_g13421 [Phytophthora cactorum]|uniref:Uncharacterized protein n=1 Tax=Phytophthora cactorum TaxID=29920 RepID=A0A8T1BIL8_9STRA|nr:hypothetical protein PC112_g16196 [Phytophthora cactorum]KAG2827279.1 hypothetical protein PC111_g8630 [Phytophthora cactorum]KAG2845511.1 hypothetical protein PC113_g18165 [Phytophthora cactorum]KAG2900680.1 hypothetical protein PC115_g16137 [Phytophthora cactorum]KAG2971366.1 hypothetical protein PC118_g16334 [Phytophthora cactorum]